MPPQLQLLQQQALPQPRHAAARRCRCRARTHVPRANLADSHPDAPPAPTRGRVAVVGGGIAGLAATLALRNRGFEATCYEAARSGEALDQLTGLILRTDAMAALRRIDAAVADAVTAEGDVLTRVLLRAPDGRLLEQRALYGDGGDSSTDGSSAEEEEGEGAEGEPATVCVRWGVLWRALAGALPLGALRFDHALQGFEVSYPSASGSGDGGGDGGDGTSTHHHEPVMAIFGRRDDSRSAVRADALVGADGLHSRVRAAARRRRAASRAAGNIYLLGTGGHPRRVAADSAVDRPAGAHAHAREC
jgi:2-polyprenyl-6-methoxyphenol hydroxylase-like FAD-dependent oxidoreductase